MSDDCDRSISRDIKRTANKLRRCIDLDAAAAGYEFTDISCTGRWTIMFVYDHMGEDVFQRDIEREFDIRGSTSSNVLSLLEKKGFIERVSVDYDARLRKIVLTQRALERCARMKQGSRSFDERLACSIPREKLAVFYEVLDRIDENADGAANDR